MKEIQRLSSYNEHTDPLFFTWLRKKLLSGHSLFTALLLQIMGLRCPQAKPLYNKIPHPSLPSRIEMKHENKALLPAFWKAGLRHSIKQHIIKTHFERKITSSIFPQIVRAIFQRPSIMEIMKRQFHPWVELGRPSAMPALCFIALGCKRWDTGPRVVDTSSAVHGPVSHDTRKSTVQETELKSSGFVEWRWHWVHCDCWPATLHKFCSEFESFVVSVLEIQASEDTVMYESV